MGFQPGGQFVDLYGFAGPLITPGGGGDQDYVAGGQPGNPFDILIRGNFVVVKKEEPVTPRESGELSADPFLPVAHIVVAGGNHDIAAGGKQRGRRQRGFGGIPVTDQAGGVRVLLLKSLFLLRRIVENDGDIEFPRFQELQDRVGQRMARNNQVAPAVLQFTGELFERRPHGGIGLVLGDPDGIDFRRQSGPFRVERVDYAVGDVGRETVSRIMLGDQQNSGFLFRRNSTGHKGSTAQEQQHCRPCRETGFVQIHIDFPVGTA